MLTEYLTQRKFCMLNRSTLFIFILFFMVLKIETINAQYINYIDTTNDRYEITAKYLKTNSGYISCGSTFYNSDQPAYFRNFVVKTYDNNLNITNTSRYGDTVSLYDAFSICKVGNFYYSGGMKSFDTLTQAVIHKFDSLGNILSEYEILNTYTFTSIVSILSIDDYLFVAGNFKDTNGDPKAFVVKMDTVMNIIWQKNFNQGINDFVILLDTCSLNNLVLSTVSLTNADDSKAFIYKLDTAGNIIWTRNFGDNLIWNGLACKELPNGNYFCYGAKENSLKGINDSWFLKLDNFGLLLNDTVISISNETDYATFGSLVNDGILVTGLDTENGTELCYLSKFDFDGSFLWKRIYGPRNFGNYLNSHIDLQNGFHLLTGFVYFDSTINTNDEWFLIVDEFGCDVSNCNLSLNEIDKNDYFSIYPNPAIQNFNIEIPSNINSRIEIYNSIGELAYSTISSASNLEINTQNYENGIYLVTINSDNFIQTQKILISK